MVWLKKAWQMLCNERGEVATGATPKGDPAPADKTFTQAQLDGIVQDRLAREKAKFGDYEELKQFKTEHEKQLEAATQKELEAKKEYDKLKEGWTKKEQELMGVVSKKDTELLDMKIETALMGEISKQNAYADETKALLKSQAVYNKEQNTISIKGKDANGIEAMLSVEEGVAQFLKTRPHLVKVTKKDGGGTAGGGTAAGLGAGTDDLGSVTVQLQEARMRGEHKKVQELTQKLKSLMPKSGRV